MLRRFGSSMLLAIMLCLIAVGDGRLFADDREECATAMTHGQQERAPANDRCDLPWSPGCASAAACVQPAPTVTSPTHRTIGLERNAPHGAVSQAPDAVDIAPDHPPPRA